MHHDWILFCVRTSNIWALFTTIKHVKGDYTLWAKRKRCTFVPLYRFLQEKNKVMAISYLYKVMSTRSSLWVFLNDDLDEIESGFDISETGTRNKWLEMKYAYLLNERSKGKKEARNINYKIHAIVLAQRQKSMMNN